MEHTLSIIPLWQNKDDYNRKITLFSNTYSLLGVLGVLCKFTDLHTFRQWLAIVKIARGIGCHVQVIADVLTTA